MIDSATYTPEAAVQAFFNDPITVQVERVIRAYLQDFDEHTKQNSNEEKEYFKRLTKSYGIAPKRQKEYLKQAASYAEKVIGEYETLSADKSRGSALETYIAGQCAHAPLIDMPEVPRPAVYDKKTVSHSIPIFSPETGSLRSGIGKVAKIGFKGALLPQRTVEKGMLKLFNHIDKRFGKMTDGSEENMAEGFALSANASLALTRSSMSALGATGLFNYLCGNIARNREWFSQAYQSMDNAYTQNIAEKYGIDKTLLEATLDSSEQYDMPKKGLKKQYIDKVHNYFDEQYGKNISNPQRQFEWLEKFYLITRLEDYAKNVVDKDKKSRLTKAAQHLKDSCSKQEALYQSIAANTVLLVGIMRAASTGVIFGGATTPAETAKAAAILATSAEYGTIGRSPPILSKYQFTTQEDGSVSLVLKSGVKGVDSITLTEKSWRVARATTEGILNRIFTQQDMVPLYTTLNSLNGTDALMTINDAIASGEPSKAVEAVGKTMAYIAFGMASVSREMLTQRVNERGQQEQGEEISR